MALPAMARFGLIRFEVSREHRHFPPDFTQEQGNTLAKLEAQPKAFTTDAEQACAATDEGRIVPREGGGNPEIDNAARNAGSLGDRPLIVLTAGKYWAPPGFEKEAAEYHEIWVHQLQASLVRLSTCGRQIIVDAHHDMAESPDSVVTAVRQVVEEVRAKEQLTAPTKTNLQPPTSASRISRENARLRFRMIDSATIPSGEGGQEGCSGASL
jgi:hypothetical protein